MGRALVIRKRQDGSTTIESGLPDAHVFPARFIEREIATGLVEVRVTLKTSDGDVHYMLDHFERNADDGEDPNFTAWECTRQEE